MEVSNGMHDSDRWGGRAGAAVCRQSADKTLFASWAACFRSSGLYVPYQRWAQFLSDSSCRPPVMASREQLDVILAFDLDTVNNHSNHLRENGLIIYDAESIKHKFFGPQYLDIPFVKLTEEIGVDKIMANSVAVGAVLGVLGLGLDLFAETVRDAMGKKGEGVIASNVTAAQTGLDFVLRKRLRMKSFAVEKTQMRGHMLINGNQAVGLGTLMSGCKFYAAYPMTPSTGIMIYMASKAKKYGIVVEQAEDEIAAINMALGASFGGVRAMTGTSGGGFALMTEGVERGQPLT